MTFSIMLWMPSWGGMINEIMTLSGAWDKLRTDPVLRMMVVSVAFYGMSTFEGPMMSVKIVNSLSHYTDWTIGHVHSGALGWVGYISFGALYCLVPWLWNRPLYSLKLVNWHFWISTVGIVLYISAMWVSGDEPPYWPGQEKSIVNQRQALGATDPASNSGLTLPTGMLASVSTGSG